MKNLKFVGGVSAEQIRRKLDSARIKYDFNDSLYGRRPQNSPYFRETLFRLELEFTDQNVERVTTAIDSDFDRSNSKPKYITYLGYYQIEHEFDFSDLDGQITFSEGRLVERTRIQFR